MRKSEARKITLPTVTAEDTRAGRELAREMLIGRRRLKLQEAGLWPPPQDWADDLRHDDFIPPYVDPNPVGDHLRSRITRGEVCVPSIRRCPKRARIEGEIRTFDWGKSSGVDAPRN
jgi:hypothetical protein